MGQGGSRDTYHDDPFDVSALSEELKDLLLRGEEGHVADVESGRLLEKLLLLVPGALEVLVAVGAQLGRSHGYLVTSLECQRLLVTSTSLVSDESQRV